MLSARGKARSATCLVLALSSFASTRAADIIDINGSVAYREATAEKGPWGEDLTEFNKLLADSPTAMGYESFSWYNISTSSTELSNVRGWSWNLTIKGDMPVSGVKNAGDYPADQVYTGGRLSFQAPQELLKQDGSGLVVNDGWGICILRWDLGGELYNQNLRTDRGVCDTALTTECKEALRDWIRPSAQAYAKGGWCNCPRVDDVPECANNDRGGLGPWNSPCHAVELDAKKLATLAGGHVDLLTFASADMYAADNLIVYNDLGSLAWPVMAVQVAGDESGIMSTTNTACVRARYGIGSWDEPTSNGTAPREMAEGQGGRETAEDGKAEKDGSEAKDSAASGVENRLPSSALFSVACLAWALLV